MHHLRVPITDIAATINSLCICPNEGAFKLIGCQIKYICIALFTKKSKITNQITPIKSHIISFLQFSTVCIYGSYFLCGQVLK